MLTPWALKNAKQVTDADSYDITVTLKGKESTTTYTGADALFENESYAYYKLSETPAYYITAWYNLLSGKWEFGKVHATETTVEGVTVELTTADGSEYGLHHVTNIWRGTELGFNTDASWQDDYSDHLLHRRRCVCSAGQCGAVRSRKAA